MLIPFNGSLLGVGALGSSIHLLLASPTGSVFLEWSPGGPIRVSVFNVVLDDVVAYSGGFFVANGAEGVYVIGRDGASLALGGYRAVKVGLNGEILASGGGKLLVMVAEGGGLRLVREYGVSGVVDADYGGGMLAYTDGLKVSQIPLEAWRRVDLVVPDSVIALEPVEVAVVGEFRVAQVRLPGVGVVNLTPTSPKYTWRPPTPGVYVVTALVDTGGSIEAISKTVSVAPRPAILTVRVGAPEVKPYSSVTLTLEVRDGLRGTPLRDVLGECLVTVAGRTYPARPWTPTMVQATPVGLEVPIEAFCRLPQPYSEARASTVLRVNESYIEVRLSYRGSGILEVTAWNKYTGEPVDGELRVLVDGSITTVKAGGTIRLPRPGVWEVKWELLSQGVTLARGVERVEYYGDLREAPQVRELLVADRLVTVTTTETSFVESPVVVTREVARVDPLTALLSFVAGLALAGAPLVILLIRRAGGGE